MRYVHFTIRGGGFRLNHAMDHLWVRKIPIETNICHQNDYSLIANIRNQNELRRNIAIICKYTDGARVLQDLIVLQCGSGYKLLVRTAEWSGRACYYAGILCVRLKQLKHYRYV